MSGDSRWTVAFAKQRNVCRVLSVAEADSGAATMPTILRSTGTASARTESSSRSPASRQTSCHPGESRRQTVVISEKFPLADCSRSRLVRTSMCTLTKKPPRSHAVISASATLALSRTARTSSSGCSPMIGQPFAMRMSIANVPWTSMLALSFSDKSSWKAVVAAAKSSSRAVASRAPSPSAAVFSMRPVGLVGSCLSLKKIGPKNTMVVTPMSIVGRPTGVIVNISNGSSGACGSEVICELRTRLVEVPMRVHMPPSIDANESGISSTCGDSPLRAAQPSQTLISMATIGVFAMPMDMAAVG
mmetsp:Transcript_1735/g.3549  ORF Transcript_1735/g.3549 Transcript_1735/m.3549 type:complete len:303 (-) Transcript_1735:606-1514(-)